MRASPWHACHAARIVCLSDAAARQPIQLLSAGPIPRGQHAQEEPQRATPSVRQRSEARRVIAARLRVAEAAHALGLE